MTPASRTAIACLVVLGGFAIDSPEYPVLSRRMPAMTAAPVQTQVLPVPETPNGAVIASTRSRRVTYRPVGQSDRSPRWDQLAHRVTPSR